MSRLLSMLRHALSIAILPGTITILVPRWILASRIPHPATPGTVFAAAIAGAVVIAAGLALMAATIGLFASRGRGTLAPWDPPRQLVVRGIYRQVRNPMITGVITVLIGEALAFRSLGVLEWAGAFAALNAVYIPLLEEPMLVARFGDAYREYCRHVPRWIPRRDPWEPPA